MHGNRLIYRFATKVLPEVDKILEHYTGICSEAQDKELAQQAKASIAMKRFHSQGGSAYALYPGTDMEGAIQFIVALQTISDYLDNLCDRAGIYDEAAFRQLHVSMLDAVDPDREIGDYYIYYPYKGDNNYLSRIVNDCRTQVLRLPSYSLVKEKVLKYVELYSEMQTYKHLDVNTREIQLRDWSLKHLDSYPGITVWEFCAAAGSTLLVFTLFAAASDPFLTAEQAESIEKAYFPWICGLHILLDYYIDADEDALTGELNFTSYYDNLRDCQERLAYFLEKSFVCTTGLPYPKFHSTIIRGLISLYLSDPKAHTGLNRIATINLIKRGKTSTKIYTRICTFLRSINRI